MKCKGHGCGNGAKKGLELFMPKDVEDDVFTMLIALINTASVLHELVPEFVQAHTGYHDSDEDPIKLAEFWATLGIKEPWLGRFIEVNPWWDGTSLLVSPALEHDPERKKKIESVTHYGYSWLKFTVTRFCRITVSGRKYMRSYVCGIDGIVKLAWDRDSGCHYTLHGHDRSKFATRRVLALASVAVRPAEDVLLELMKDDRLLRRGPELLETFQKSIASVSEISDFTYDRLAALVGDGCQGSDLRNWSERVAATTAGYVDRDVFHCLRTEPHSVTQGDIDANLEAIRAREAPFPDYTIEQIHNLLVGGFRAGEIPKC